MSGVNRYPCVDAQGYYWYDSITFRSIDGVGNCFICLTPTDRIDVCFEAYYCGSDLCDDDIRRQLEEANAKTQGDTVEL